MTEPDQVVNLSEGAERTSTVLLVLPDRPDVRWFALAVPVPLTDVEDQAVSVRRQIAVDAAACARETAEPLVYSTVGQIRAGVLSW